MDNTQFWQIIGKAGRRALEDPEAYLSAVRKRLRKLTAADLKAFRKRYDQQLAAAYRWDLWGAAYLINGGCSDDGFHYFQGWLISQGQAAYTRALENPDSLARRVDPENDNHELEELEYLADEVYEELTGRAMPDTKVKFRGPKGEDWDFDDDQETARRLPKLAKRYLS